MPLRPFRTIRGCNILPMVATSKDLHLAWHPVHDLTSSFPVTNADGFFVPRHADSEIRQMAALGVNSVRLWGSFMAWFMDPKEYLQNLEYYCRKLATYKIGVQYVLFSAVPAGSAAAGGGAFTLVSSIAGMDRATLRTAIWTLDTAWQTSAPAHPTGTYQLSHWPEPFDNAEWLAHGAFNPGGNTYDSFVLQYVAAMANFFANNPAGQAVYDSMDMYNEVNIGASDATRWTNMRNMIRTVEQTIRAIHPVAKLGCGMAGIPSVRTQELVQSGIKIDFLGIHAYDRTNVAGYINAGLSEAAICGIPTSSVIISEALNILTDGAGAVADYTTGMRNANMGGYMWSALRNNVWPIVDGLMRPTGLSNGYKTNDDITFEPAYPTDLSSFIQWCAAPAV